MLVDSMEWLGAVDDGVDVVEPCLQIGARNNNRGAASLVDGPGLEQESDALGLAALGSHDCFGGTAEAGRTDKVVGNGLAGRLHGEQGDV